MNLFLRNRGCNQWSRLGRGFTIVELLTVVAIIALLTGIAFLSVPSLITAEGITQASSDLSQCFENARTYAQANHTYVFVGIEEVDAALSTSAIPQNAATASAGGRLAVAIFASQDGTNNYGSTGTWQVNGNLVPINKLKYFQNIHLSDFSNLTAATGPMASRIAVLSSASLGNAATTNSSPLFFWPTSATSAGTAQYAFSKVIQFDPEGAASLQLGSSTASPTWMEIGLQSTHGDAVPPAPTNLSAGEIAAIQIDGINGTIRVFRP